MNKYEKTNKSKEKKKEIFEEQKNKLKKILQTCGNKILFPKDMINDISKINGLELLSYYMYGYNSFIKEARTLLKRIVYIRYWGYFFSTYEQWTISVNSIPIGIDKYKKEIVKLTHEKSDLILKSLLINLDSWQTKILTFMSIVKNNKNLDYIFCYFDNLENKEIKKSLTIQNVQMLLPVFLNSKTIKKSKESLEYNNLYYNVPDLFIF
jgi:hypothetical protein